MEVADAVEHVFPVSGEPLRFLVTSYSRPGVVHSVDIAKYMANGSCTCERFEMKLRKKARLFGESRKAARCRHIEASRNWFMDHKSLPKSVMDFYSVTLSEYDKQEGE